MSWLTRDYRIHQKCEPYCDCIQSNTQDYETDTRIEILLIHSTHQIYVYVRQNIEYFIIALELTNRKVNVASDVVDMLTFMLQETSEYLIDCPGFIRMICVIASLEKYTILLGDKFR